MIEKFFNFLKNNLLNFLILFLGFIPILWYGPGATKLIFSHDVGYALNPVEFYLNRYYAWAESINTGVSSFGFLGLIHILGLEALFTYLTGSVFIGQKIIAYLWFVLPLFSIKYVVKRLDIFKDNFYAQLFAIILYGINFFQLQGWSVFWRSRFTIYVALPLLFIIFYEFLLGKRKFLKSIFLSSVLLFFFNGGGSPPIFGSLLILYFSTSFYYLLMSDRNELLKNVVKIVKFFIGLAFVSLFISAFWIIPYLYFIKNSFSLTMNSMGGPMIVLDWTDSVTKFASPINLLRLQGLDFFNESSSYDFIKHLLSDPLWILISFLWPFLALSSFLLVKKKDIRLLLLIFILAFFGLVFTAGSHPPFRNFYILLLKFVPGFAIFRSTVYKFGGLFWFSYSLLISYSIGMVVLKVKNFKIFGKKTPLYLLVTVILLAATIYWNKNFFTGTFFIWNKPLTIMEEIPDYVLDYQKWISRQSFQERILLLPELNKMWKADVFTWGYFSLSPLTTLMTSKNTLVNDSNVADTEEYLVNKLYENIKTKNDVWKKIAGLLNVKYLLLRNDYFYNLDWSSSVNPQIYVDLLKLDKTISNIHAEGEWNFYEINNPYFLPKIYTPNHLTLLDDRLSGAVEILDRVSSDKPLLIFHNDKFNTFETKLKESNVTQLKKFQCFMCGGDDFASLKDKVSIPEVRFVPGSIFYFLTQFKDEKLLKVSEPGQKIDSYLILSGKRLGEVSSMLKSTNSTQNEVRINIALKKYQEYLVEIYKNLDQLEGLRKNEYQIRVLVYFAVHKNFLENFASNGISRSVMQQVSENLAVYFQELNSKVWVTDDLFKKKYLYEESQTESEYEIVKPENTDGILVNIDGENISSNKIKLKKGLHRLVVDIPKINYFKKLNGNNDNIYELKSGSEVNLGEIANYDNSYKYIFKFKYKIIRGKSPAFVIGEELGSKYNKTQNTRNVPINLKENVGENDFEFIVQPQVNTKNVFFKLLSTELSFDSTLVEITDIEVIKNIIPEIFLLRKGVDEKYNLPDLSYKKINPTYYMIKIRGGQGSFPIVFSEKYDPGWNLYIKKTNNDQGKDKNIKNQYFNNQITEYFSNNQFFNFEVLKLLFLKPVDQSQHFMANGYANGWMIDEKGDYEIVIEYKPQRILYVSLLISYISVFVGIIFLIRWRKKNE